MAGRPSKISAEALAAAREALAAGLPAGVIRQQLAERFRFSPRTAGNVLAMVRQQGGAAEKSAEVPPRPVQIVGPVEVARSAEVGPLTSEQIYGLCKDRLLEIAGSPASRVGGHKVQVLAIKELGRIMGFHTERVLHLHAAKEQGELFSREDKARMIGQWLRREFGVEDAGPELPAAGGEIHGAA